jgi:hypothetical protein
MPPRRESAALRVFTDSGVLLEGILSPWSASRGVLILARSGLFRIVLADDVRAEVEDNLLDLLADDPRLAGEAIDAYARPLRLLSPERMEPAAVDEVTRHRHLIRHADRHQSRCVRIEFGTELVLRRIHADEDPGDQFVHSHHAVAVAVADADPFARLWSSEREEHRDDDTTW